MTAHVVLPLLTAGLAFAFSGLVISQWLRRRQPYQLVWGLGLGWYGIGAAAEFVGGAFGWSEALYRTWYAFGAFGVAAYLGLGTIFLLNRTRFGYFVAGSFVLAALFSYLAASRYAREGEPVSVAVTLTVVVAALLAASLVAGVTRFRRRSLGGVTAGIVIPASMVAAIVALSVPLAGAGYALDATSGAPIGAAFPSDVRIVTPPFNIVGAFSLVFGAFYSAYIFMPKRRVVRVDDAIPALARLPLRAVAVPINLAASLPATWRAFRGGELNPRVPATALIAAGGFFPSIADGLTRFGVTWALFLGQFVGVLLIFGGFVVAERFAGLRLPPRSLTPGTARHRILRPPEQPQP